MHYALNINLKKSIVRYIKLYSNYFFIYFLVIVIGLFSNYNNFEVYNNNLLFFLNDLLGLSYIYGTPLYNYTWWYIGMAFFIIFIVPFIIEICKRNGGGGLIIVSVLIPLFRFNSEVLNRYFPIICIGVYCAYSGCLKEICKKPTILLSIIYLIVSLLQIKLNSFYIIEPLQIILISSIVMKIKNGIVGNILIYFGKHSMNIFLTHTFLYYYFAQDFIYSCSHFILIFFNLLLCSLLISYIMNFIKKLVHYDLLIKKIILYVESHILFNY